MRYNGIFKAKKAPDDYDVPVCPCCGEECDTLYKQGGIVLGCEMCIEEVSAWEVMENENL